MGTPAPTSDAPTKLAPATQVREPTDIAWAAIAFLVPAILGLVSSMGAIDLAYHLRTGAEILADHALPHVDTFTFSVDGTPWVDQQWGAQLVLTGVFRLGGWPTLTAFQAVLGTVSFSFVYLAARARGAAPRVATIVTLAGFLIAYPMVTLRPQLVALPLFGAALWAVETRRRAPGRLWIVPVAAAVAANVHGSFTLFPVLAAIAWLGDLREGSDRARRSLLIAVLTGLATLLNPSGVGAWAYAFDLSTDPIIRESITEWAPVTIASSLGAAMLASVFVVTVIFARRTTPVPWLDLLTLGIFLILALSALRAILWWAMVAPVIVAGLFPETRRQESRTGGSPAASRGPAFLMIGGLSAAIVVLLPWWRGSDASDHLEAAPPGITAALAELPSRARIFTYQPWGSWFIYALPDKPVFVDSRIEIVPEDVWQDYFQVAFAKAEWREALHRWQPDAVVGQIDEWDETIELLRADDAWRVYYEDEDGVVFVPAAT